MQRRRTVLISEPHAIDYPFPFLPYMWAVLKSSWERHGGDRDAFTWLDPIFMNADPATLLASSDADTIDVLGLSCYTWNWNLQCALAARVKARNPQCLVVAGGPDPDYRDPAFPRQHPYIDIVVEKDGEITFNKILATVLRGDRAWDDIGGLWIRGANGGPLRSTGAAEVPTVFDYSPYVDQTSYYERLVAGARPGGFHATLETNRGCPYACTFCDWGSSTMSKVRRFEMDRIKAEVDWLGRMKVGNVMCADANFGILERDLEIADWVNQSVRTHRHPYQFHYSAAKNNPDRVVEIAQKFVETGVCALHILAVQHTRAEVLEATDRANIPTAKYVQVVQTLMERRVPITVQLILGIPGDRYELWKGCLGDLMEWGVHDDYDVYFYCLLPNAPSASPAFLGRWEVETVDRYIFSSTIQPWKPAELDVRTNRSRLVVKSSTFSREDWVRMFVYAVMVKALHNASMTRLVAMYLRMTHQVTYQAFYEAVIEDFLPHDPLTRPWYEAVDRCYRRFLDDEDARDRIAVDALPGFPFSLEPSRWVDVQICRELDRFFDALGTFLLKRFPDAHHLASALDYQRELIIVPSYDRRRGKSFPTDRDWPQYFSAAARRTGTETLPEPQPAVDAQVEISDQTCGEAGYLIRPLDWGEGDEQDRWIEWIHNAVMHRNSAAKRNFQQVRLRLPSPAAVRA